MVGERDIKFYAELKQTNEDLVNYLNKCHEKSPFFDYTLTFNDYVKQVDNLLKQYPEKNQIFGHSTSGATIFSSSISSNSFLNSSTTATNPQLSSPLPPSAVFSSNLPTFTFCGLKKDDNEQAEQQANVEELNDQDDEPQPVPSFEEVREENTIYSVKAKLYERGRGTGSELKFDLLGVGRVYVKSLSAKNKLQLVFRQEPDLRRVLFNETINPDIPIKLLPKAVSMVHTNQTLNPSPTNEPKNYILKTKDDGDAKNLYDTLAKIKS